jgi:hypothetical protein
LPAHDRELSATTADLHAAPAEAARRPHALDGDTRAGGLAGGRSRKSTIAVAFAILVSALLLSYGLLQNPYGFPPAIASSTPRGAQHGARRGLHVQRPADRDHPAGLVVADVDGHARHAVLSCRST